MKPEELEVYNAEFNRDALEVRYELPSGKWMKTKPLIPLYSTARTINYVNAREVMFVIDIDIYYLNLRRQIWKYLSKRIGELKADPLVVFSGKKGFHIIEKFIFPQPHELMYKFMEKYAYYLWKHWDLGTINLKYTNKGSKTNGVGTLDKNMFHNKCLIRGFGPRFENRKPSKYYSVPIDKNDSWETILRKSSLRETCNYYGIPEIYVEREDFEDFCKIHNSQLREPKNISVNVKGVLADPDPSHRERWEMVWYLFNEGMSEQEIIDYIMANAKWADLNYNIVKYQTAWTCRWASKLKNY